VRDQIAADLRRRIADGEWPEDRRMPGEVALSQEYEVARGTIREALAVLREEGLIETDRGRGSWVVRPVKRPAEPPRRASPDSWRTSPFQPPPG